MATITEEERLLAAIAYGEASELDDTNEIGAIAWAVANRARLWGGCSVKTLLQRDPNYTYAVTDGNQRFGLLKGATETTIENTPGMKAALAAAREALAGTGTDLAAGGIWWDGRDFKTNAHHPKRQAGFSYSDAAHNLFGVAEVRREVIIYWQTRNKKTGELVNTKERGRYDHVYESTAAYGRTIVWRYNPDYLVATGAKA